MSITGTSSGEPSVSATSVDVLTGKNASVPVPPPDPNDASTLSRLFLTWMSPMLSQGAKEPLRTTHLCPLPSTLTSTSTQHLFDAPDSPGEAWLRERVKAHFKPQFLLSGALYLVFSLTQLVSPLLLREVISHLDATERDPDSDSAELSYGLTFAAALALVTLLGEFCKVQSVRQVLDMLFELRAGLVSTVYSNALRIGVMETANTAEPSSDDSEEPELSAGNVVTLVTADCQKLLEYPPGLHMAWNAPIIIIVGIALLYREVGPSSIGGVAVIFLLMPLIAYLTRDMSSKQREAVAVTDTRVGTTRNALEGIHVVKMYGWEKAFADHIGSIRHREVSLLAGFLYAKALSFSAFVSLPFLATVTTFVIYTSDSDNELTAAKVFTSLALLNVIRFPFTFLPLAINFWVQAGVSFDRVEQFLSSVERAAPSRPVSSGAARGVSFAHVDFAYSNERGAAMLHDVSLDVPLDGQLVAVTGMIASGKTSVLRSILGETHATPSPGAVDFTCQLPQCHIAYVPQSAFITHGTVRENILFGKPFRAEWYSRVVRACALEADLALFPRGDQTEIGAGGVNISGGQQQRISLARAAYDEEAQLVLLDDPLSAVDPQVARTLYRECISGLMAGRTRVLVTNSLQFLGSAGQQDSWVVMMGDGGIQEQGTFGDLVQRDGPFAALYHAFESGTQEAEERAGEYLADTPAPGVAGDKKVVEELVARSDLDDRELAQALAITNHRASTADLQSLPVEDIPAVAAKQEHRLVDDEEYAVGAVPWSTYWVYFTHGGGLVRCAQLFALFFMLQVFDFWNTWWLGFWAESLEDEEAGDGEAQSHAFYLSVYLCSVACATGIIVLRSFLIVRTGLAASTSLHTTALGNILTTKSIAFFHSNPLGRLLNRFSADLYELDVTLPLLFENMLASYFAVGGIVVLIIAVLPFSLIGLLPLFLGYLSVRAHYTHSARALRRLEANDRSPLISHLSQSISGAVCIRAFGAVDHFKDVFHAYLDAHQQAFYMAETADMWLELRLGGISSAIVLFVSFGAVGAASDAGQDALGYSIDVSTTSLLLTFMLVFTYYLNWAVKISTQVEAKMNSVERVLLYCGQGDDGFTESQERSTDPTLPHHRRAFGTWPSAGAISIRNLCVRYRPNLPLVLKDICIEVPAGTRVALTGRSGSGKSSLMASLFRLQEADKGAIFIDGVDISRVHLSELRQSLAIIPQSPVLFAGSLRYNLDPFAAFGDDELWEILEYVGLKGVFADGLDDTEIRANGGNLSAGQRQLICLARALLKKPAILCLDEATASVDAQTDAFIQRAVRERFADATVVCIAHRLNTVMDYDTIVVLDQGRVVEMGAPQELMIRGDEGVFASMVEAHVLGAD